MCINARRCRGANAIEYDHLGRSNRKALDKLPLNRQSCEVQWRASSGPLRCTILFRLATRLQRGSPPDNDQRPFVVFCEREFSGTDLMHVPRRV